MVGTWFGSEGSIKGTNKIKAQFRGENEKRSLEDKMRGGVKGGKAQFRGENEKRSLGSKMRGEKSGV